MLPRVRVAGEIRLLAQHLQPTVGCEVNERYVRVEGRVRVLRPGQESHRDHRAAAYGAYSLPSRAEDVRQPLLQVAAINLEGVIHQRSRRGLPTMAVAEREAGGAISAVMVGVLLGGSFGGFTLSQLTWPSLSIDLVLAWCLLG